MSKFKDGDEVRLDDGREGVVLSNLYSHMKVGYYIINLGNKREEWYEGGLTKIDKPKFKDGDVVYAECVIKDASGGRTSERMEVRFQDHTDEYGYDLAFIDSRNFFKKEDLTNEQV